MGFVCCTYMCVDLNIEPVHANIVTRRRILKEIYISIRRPQLRNVVGLSLLRWWSVMNFFSYVSLFSNGSRGTTCSYENAQLHRIRHSVKTRRKKECLLLLFMPFRLHFRLLIFLPFQKPDDNPTRSEVQIVFIPTRIIDRHIYIYNQRRKWQKSTNMADKINNTLNEAISGWRVSE